MIARAPGKLVLSGAYAVLEGAPAIVTAVDRYVFADAARRSDLVTEEVQAAIEAGELGHAPFFDASALRVVQADGSTRKVGLGSSAAIVAASIGAALPEELSEEDLRARVFPLALAAHRKAQKGGSGIDVAASVFGGTLRYELAETGTPRFSPHALPGDAAIEVFTSPRSASTSRMLAEVRAYAERDRSAYTAVMGRVRAGAELALAAGAASPLADALRVQYEALAELGREAGASIVTPEEQALERTARTEGGSFGPSGAGGGDVAVFVGCTASSPAFRAEAARAGFERWDVAIGALGLHRIQA